MATIFTKRSLFFLALLVSAGCRSGQEKPRAAAALSDSVAVSPAMEAGAGESHHGMTDSVSSQIISYYRNLYGSDSVSMTISRSDSLVELSFSNASPEPDAYNGVLFLANISLPADGRAALRGDLNGDGLEDLLVSVHTEGGGGGGNVWWTDHFVFLSDTGGRFTLADSKSDDELLDGSGYFFPDSIGNGLIVGVSNEYAQDDGHCCPSRFNSIELLLKNNSLVQVKKIAIPKPGSFD